MNIVTGLLKIKMYDSSSHQRTPTKQRYALAFKEETINTSYCFYRCVGLNGPWWCCTNQNLSIVHPGTIDALTTTVPFPSVVPGFVTETCSQYMWLVFSTTARPAKQ